MNNITILQHTWVDPMNCPYCQQVTMFRYSNEYEHKHLLECTGSWDRSVPGCGFKWVMNCTPYKLGSIQEQVRIEANFKNFMYAREMHESGMCVADIGVLIPITITGDSMYPTLQNRQSYICQVMNDDLSEYENGKIYSLLLWQSQLNCCRVFQENDGYRLSKDNRLFEKGTDLWVQSSAVYFGGKVLVHE